MLHCGLTTPSEVLAVAEIKLRQHNCWESCYANFAQYKCLSWGTPSHALSIVLPKRTTLRGEGDLAAIIESFATVAVCND